MSEELDLSKALEDDKVVNQALGELVTLGLSPILEKSFNTMKEWAYKQFLIANTHDDRLKVQAYCACLDGLEKRVRRLSKSAELHAREITVT